MTMVYTEPPPFMLEILPRVLSAAWVPMQAGVVGAVAYQCRGLRVIVSALRDDAGRDWIHASFSRAGRLPDWEDVKRVKSVFLQDRWAVQILPPPDEYINIHPYCLHLWHCVTERIIPDFRITDFNGKVGI